MKRLSTLIIATTLSLAATAQREIQTLFDRIDSLPGQNLMAKDNYSDHNDLPTTYCHYSYITLAKSTFGDLDQQIKQTFTTQPKAYRIFRKTRDMRYTNSEVLVTYGPSQEYKITFGSHDTHNYLVDFYRDSLDTAKRHAYAIVWYTEADQVHLLRYHIYGDDPRHIDNQRTITYGNNLFVDNSGNIVISSTDKKDPTIATDLDFLRRFGTLRAAMVSHSQGSSTMILTGIAIKILDLCKKHKQLLNDNERATCDKSLLELIKNYTGGDTYVQGLLEEARMEVGR